MIKVKDGYAKLVGTTASGSASHILLSNGGVKAVSDFASAFNVKLWGLDFDGSSDVNGNMTGVGDITMSGSINSVLKATTSLKAVLLNVSEIKANINYIHLYVSSLNNSATNTRALVLQNGYGNVGIGTTSPEYKLDVNGVIRASSHLITNARVKILDGLALEWNDTAANGSTSNLLLPRKSYGYRLDYYDGTAWHKLAYADDIPTVTNYYWANIPISNTSSTTTNPTFGSITVPLAGLIVGSKSTDTSPTRVLMCYDTTLTTKYMNIGNDPSAGNTGEFHYVYSANASTSNNVGLGFYSGNRLKLYYNGGSGVGKAVIASALSGGTEYELLHLGNYKNYVDDMYWANIPLQSISDTTKIPIFGGLTVNGHAIINKRLTIGLDLGVWDNGRAELELISPSGQANDLWLGSGLRDWVITSRPAAENNTLNFYAHVSSNNTIPLVMVLEKSGNTTIYGNLQIGKDDTRNYIAFRGTTGDNPGSFNHTYIGENLWGGSESSELILYKGNDMGATATTVNVSGPDRIRHIAGGHLFQIYKSALSGTFEAICASTVPVNMLAIHLNSIQTYAPLVIVGEKYSGNYGINMLNSDIVGINALYTSGNAEDGGKGLQFSRGNGYYDSIWASGGVLYFSPNGNLNRSGSYSNNYTVLHTGNYTGTLDGRYVNVTGDTMTGNLTVPSLNSYYVFKTTDIAEGAANLGTLATAHTITFFRNGIMIPYKMDNNHDGGMIRTKGASENSCVFEMATWDDAGAGETIQFNYYPTTSQVTPTYSVSVPKKSGTIALTSDLPPVKAYKWNATILGSTWSRLYTGNPSTMHHSSIFSISGSIGCVLFSHTFLVESNHSTSARIIQLVGGNYTQFSIRTLVNSDGDVIIDMHWAGNDCSVGSSTLKMTVEINAICLSGSISPTTSFVSDASIPSGYSSSCSYTTRAGSSIFMELYAHENVYASHFYENSDIKLKENINLISSSDNIPLLKEFNWKSDGKHSYGLIAQELEAMGYSELVEDSGDHKTVNYSAALSLIVGKLQVKIKELEKEIEILKNKN